MPYIAPEVVQEAKRMDLLTYLQNYEPQELVHFGGNTYCTREHDSLKISNGKGAEDRFDFIKYPNSKYSRAIKSNSPQDMEKLMAALLKMRQEDPTWKGLRVGRQLCRPFLLPRKRNKRRCCFRRQAHPRTG